MSEITEMSDITQKNITERNRVLRRRATLAERGRFMEMRDDSWRSYFLFQCCGDWHRPYLEHLTAHNEFSKRGVHYVGWLDVLVNFSARARLGWKFLLIVVASFLLTGNILYDVTGLSMLDDGVSETTVTYLTFGLTLLQGFRTAQSYARYNDARANWGMMVNRTRNVSRLFFCYVADAELCARANKWLIGYVYACKQSLRFKPRADELGHTLSEAELHGLHGAKHMPLYCLEQLSACAHEAYTKKLVDSIVLRMIDDNLTGFEDYIGASERLLKTPVPYGIVLHLRTIMMLDILCLPLYLAAEGGLGWAAAPITVIFAYTLTSIEDLSQAIETPFAQHFHALPLDSICATIRANLLEIQGRHASAA